HPDHDFSRLPTTYYHPFSPVGRVMQKFNWFGRDERLNHYDADARTAASLAGLGAAGPLTQACAAWSEPPYAAIGLGVGTIAAYARPFQHCHFYELDAKIRGLSVPQPGSRTYFGYVQDARSRGAAVPILLGDGRLRLSMSYTPHDEERE